MKLWDWYWSHLGIFHFPVGVLAFLKFVDVIDWTWGVVFLPLTIPACVYGFAKIADEWHAYEVARRKPGYKSMDDIDMY